jgi:hypothetical protein
MLITTPIRSEPKAEGTWVREYADAEVRHGRRVLGAVWSIS